MKNIQDKISRLSENIQALKRLISLATLGVSHEKAERPERPMDRDDNFWAIRVASVSLAEAKERLAKLVAKRDAMAQEEKAKESP